MTNPEMTELAQHIAHEVLVWIGFGTVVGLTAKLIMPGRDPGGAIGTMLMGIGGSLIGCGVLLLINSEYRVSPVSPLGFVAGTAGAFLLLVFFRLLSNSYVVEPVDGRVTGAPGVATTTYYRRRRRPAA